MRLIFKQMQTPDGLRSAYVAIPEVPKDRHWKSSAITFLREDDTEMSVLEILRNSGLARMVDEEKSVIAFPNPIGGKWAAGDGAEMTADEKFVFAFGTSALPSGFYSDGWRSPSDVHYLVGVGSGATLVHTLAACRPISSLAAAICTVGGELPDKALKNAVGSPIPAYILNGTDAAIRYFITANKAEEQANGRYVCPYNHAQKVLVSAKTELDAEAAGVMWEEFLRLTRRTNTSPFGDVDRRLVPETCGFEWHINDVSLGDNGGLDHDWIEACPASVKKHPEKKVPLVLFSHGMGGNPIDAADQAKLHELGEKEGFVTVYPYSCDRNKWNLSMDPALYSDVDYYLALIRYLKEKYPIDETRIYTSGFSNGAGMAMLFALSHPEIVAASFPVDSTFPYTSMGRFRPAGLPDPYITPVLKPGEQAPKPFFPQESPEKNYAPLKAALAKQKEKAYTLPVMYFYGTRESEYPIRSGSNQELSYNFWKEFNRIPLSPTDDSLETDAVGVPGEKITELRPSAEHPDHVYVENIFYTRDPQPKDYYHFLLMRGKAHDVHPVERELGWAFVSRFSRNADGSLRDTMFP